MRLNSSYSIFLQRFCKCITPNNKYRFVLFKQNKYIVRKLKGKSIKRVSIKNPIHLNTKNAESKRSPVNHLRRHRRTINLVQSRFQSPVNILPRTTHPKLRSPAKPRPANRTAYYLHSPTSSFGAFHMSKGHCRKREPTQL